jgi:hypothetical protein
VNSETPLLAGRNGVSFGAPTRAGTGRGSGAAGRAWRPYVDAEIYQLARRTERQLLGAEGGSVGAKRSTVDAGRVRSYTAPLVWEGFPSGQRDQTVNLTAQPSEVRILPPPPIGCKPEKRFEVARCRARGAVFVFKDKRFGFDVMRV